MIQEIDLHSPDTDIVGFLKVASVKPGDHLIRRHFIYTLEHRNALLYACERSRTMILLFQEIEFMIDLIQMVLSGRRKWKRGRGHDDSPLYGPKESG